MSAEDRMRALMTGYRREIAPTSRDRERVWDRLETAEVEPAPAPPRVAVIAVVGALAAAIVMLALGVVDGTMADHREVPTQSVDEAAADPDVHTISRDAPVAELPAPSQPARTPLLRDEPAVVSPRVQRPHVRPDATTAEDPLRAELPVIAAAQDALERGAYDDVLAHVAEHRRRFPTGALAREGRALRALALCGAGRVAQGRGEARALLRDDPSSPYRDRLRDRCGLQ